MVDQQTVPSLPVRKFFARLASAFILVFLFFLTGCAEQSETPAKISIKLGLPLQPSSSLSWIAVKQGYFEQHGLDVSLKSYPSGKRVLLDGFLAGEIDFMSSADAPVVDLLARHSPDLKILGTIYGSDNFNRIVARADSGITELSDLRGKRVATQSNSAVHYFLSSVLVQNDIGIDEIDLQFMRAEELATALYENRIDAFSMREPIVSEALHLLGEANTVVLESPGAYVQSELLLARGSELDRQPEIATRMLKALIDAENFARNAPDEAMRVVADAIDSDVEAVQLDWHDYNLNVRLSQGLLSQLERMFAWIDREIDPNLPPPEFLDIIVSEPLRELAPERVSLVQ